VTPAQQRVRRILVALDASRNSLDALRAAAGLAARLGAELTGLFVEDVNLLRLAGLPFARQLSVSGGEGRPVERNAVEAELRALAARARESLEAAAAPQHISWSFRVVRGQVAVEVVTAASASDLLVVGWAGHRVAGSPGPGGTARAVATRAPTSVLILTRHGEVERRLLVAFDGSEPSHRALSLAARLEEAGAGTITLLLAAPGREAAERLAEEARLRLGLAAAPPGRWIGGARLSDLMRAVRDLDALLVLGAESALLGGAEGLERLLDRVACPVLLVR
jgi:nucleotide-binding universal stress UspA family protein